MRAIIRTARYLFTFITWVLIVASVYVVINLRDVNGTNGLAILGATVACIGVIASWQTGRDS
jgi:hypothetical protein